MENASPEGKPAWPGGQLATSRTCSCRGDRRIRAVVVAKATRSILMFRVGNGHTKGRLLRPSGKAIKTEIEIGVLRGGVVEAVAPR